MIDEPLTVKVDSSDLRDGKRNQGDRCTLALAFKRKYPEVQNVHISRKDVRFQKGGTEYRRPLTDEAKKFIDSFDDLRTKDACVAGEITVTDSVPTLVQSLLRV